MARRSSAERAARALVAAAAAAATVPSFAAMQSLDDAEMSAANAQDGIRITYTDPGSATMTQYRWITDSGAVLPSAANPCIGGVLNQHGCTIIGNGELGSGPNGPLQIRASLDVGASAALGGTMALGLHADWQNFMLKLGRLTLATPTADYSANSIGSFAIHSQGSLDYNSLTAPSNAGGGANLDFASSGDIFYRQGGPGSPELSFGNFAFNNRFTNGAAGGQVSTTGTVGIDDTGLIVTAPFADTDLLFDLAFKTSPADFDTTGRSSITLFGWTGGLVNPTFRIGPGGIAYGSYATTANNLNGNSYNFYDLDGTHGGGARSEGLYINSSWDFDTDFSWVIGQAGGNRTQVRFSNWRRLGTAPSPMLTMPVTLDVVQNANGPAGLCAGGGFTAGSPLQASCTAAGGAWIATGVPAGRAALATFIRDAGLHAYNQSVEVFDPTSILPYSAYRWSLLYTFGKLDADLYFYPEGRNPGVAVTTNATGLKADITLLAQSPGYWDQANGNAATRAALYTTGAGSRWTTNTHFLLADTAVGGNTAVQYGVGLLNADLLWMVRDMYLRVIAGDAGYPSLPGGLWLQTDTLADYHFRGLLGGGNLTALNAPSSIGLLDLNLQTSRFIFVLHPVAPSGGDAPVGFAGLLDLDGNSYFSLAEVSSPTSSFRIYNGTGRIGWANGRVQLVSGQNNPPTNLPKLTISNDLLFGASAGFGGPAGNEFLGSIGFGNEYFGRVVLPAGQWYNELTIKIPNS